MLLLGSVGYTLSMADRAPKQKLRELKPPEPKENGTVPQSPLKNAQPPSENPLAKALVAAYRNRYQKRGGLADDAKYGSRPAPAIAANLLKGPLSDMPRADFERFSNRARGTAPRVTNV